MPRASWREPGSRDTPDRDFPWLVAELENWGRWCRLYTGPDRYPQSICAMFMPHKFWDLEWGTPPPPPKIEPRVREEAAKSMERHLVALGYFHMKLIRKAFAFGGWATVDKDDLGASLRVLADRVFDVA